MFVFANLYLSVLCTVTVLNIITSLTGSFYVRYILFDLKEEKKKKFEIKKHRHTRLSPLPRGDLS